MLPAVDFDHELMLEADEIQDVWPERDLPPEFEPAQSAVS